MTILVTEQGPVHYETFGRGRPVLLLHGWLGSWALWRNTIEILGKDFRTYALDFWGFGDRGAGDKTVDYSVDNFIMQVNEFMNRLGIVKAPLIGHSMGGTVALGTAIRYPERVVKVIAVGSPIHGASLSPLLKMAGFSGWMSLAETAPVLFTAFMRGLRTGLHGYAYFMGKDGRTLGNMLAADVSKLTIGPFFQSIATLKRTDLRPRMNEINMPILGVYGKKDVIVNPNQSKVLKQYAPHSQIAWFEGSNHFPMMDEPARFYQTVREFLNNG